MYLYVCCFLLWQEPIDIGTGITDAQARKMASFLQFEGSKQDDATEQIKRLYALFLKVDATQIEINPFGETPDGEGILDLFRTITYSLKINNVVLVVMG